MMTKISEKQLLSNLLSSDSIRILEENDYFILESNNQKISVSIIDLFRYSEVGESFKAKNQQLLVREKFEKQNLSILQLRTNELEAKPQIVRSMVLARLKLLTNKIAARKMRFEKIESKEANSFFEENHLMGTNSKAVGYGLRDGNKQLLAAMSVRYFEENKTLEIIRFCSKNFWVVQGGFGKLLNKIVDIYDPASIVSFCDLRYGSGESYLELGFEKVSVSLGWGWTDFKQVYNRLRCRANMDSRSLSEKEQAREFGWSKIYDAGQAKFVKNLRPVEKTEKVVKLSWSKEEENQLLQLVGESKNISLVALKIELGKKLVGRSPSELDSKLKELAQNYPSKFIKRFGYYRTLEPLAKHSRIKVECICGKQKTASAALLIQGRVSSCGCKKSFLCSKNRSSSVVVFSKKMWIENFRENLRLAIKAIAKTNFAKEVGLDHYFKDEAENIIGNLRDLLRDENIKVNFEREKIFPTIIKQLELELKEVLEAKEQILKLVLEGKFEKERLEKVLTTKISTKAILKTITDRLT